MNQPIEKFKNMGEPGELWYTFDGVCYSGPGPYPINVSYEVQRKRLSSEQLMCEYWAANQICFELDKSVSEAKDRRVVRTTELQRATFLRLAQAPHYDETSDWEDPPPPIA